MTMISFKGNLVKTSRSLPEMGKTEWPDLLALLPASLLKFGVFKKTDS